MFQEPAPTASLPVKYVLKSEPDDDWVAYKLGERRGNPQQGYLVPVPAKPAEDKPAEDKPAEDKPAQETPAEEKPAGTGVPESVAVLNAAVNTILPEQNPDQNARIAQLAQQTLAVESERVDARQKWVKMGEGPETFKVGKSNDSIFHEQEREGDIVAAYNDVDMLRLIYRMTFNFPRVVAGRYPHTLK